MHWSWCHLIISICVNLWIGEFLPWLYWQQLINLFFRDMYFRGQAASKYVLANNGWFLIAEWCDVSTAKDTVEEFIGRNYYPAVISKLLSPLGLHLCLASVFVFGAFLTSLNLWKKVRWDCLRSVQLQEKVEKKRIYFVGVGFDRASYLKVKISSIIVFFFKNIYEKKKFIMSKERC